MSSTFMLIIGVLYLAAAGSFAWDGKFSWAAVALCWGIGNALLAHLSR